MCDRKPSAPRTAKCKREGRFYLGYDCGISKSSKQQILAKLRQYNIRGLTYGSIVGVAQFLNPYTRGWGSYSSQFIAYETNFVFQRLRSLLLWWANPRYKPYK